MKKLLAIVLALVLVLSMTACSKSSDEDSNDEGQDAGADGNTSAPAFVAEDYDQTGTCGEDAQWGYAEETGKLTIIGTGETENYEYDFDINRTTAPWSGLPFKSANIYGVTSIGNKAFSYCTGLTEITISDSVTSIGWGAFESCSGLTEITIPDSVTSIGWGAFENCSGLTEVSIGDGVTTIEYGAFSNCYNLTEITIPNSVTSIGEEAFRLCTSLAEITIPDSVTSIGKQAFLHTALTEITIPGSVTTIGKGAFFDCQKLTHIYADNEFYVDVDGVLFTKDMTTLVKYPAGRTQSSYSIPDSVTSIGDVALETCNNLTEITIPDSVTSIGKQAFEICNNLTDVYYNGTEGQWNAIEIADWNDPLTEATIHFNS